MNIYEGLKRINIIFSLFPAIGMFCLCWNVQNKFDINITLMFCVISYVLTFVIFSGISYIVRWIAEGFTSSVDKDSHRPLLK